MANQVGKRYDIIINGGGIVGFTLLNSILKSPYLNKLKVVLIEQSKKQTNFKQSSRQAESSPEGKKFSNRVSSITEASRRAFQSMGVWNELKDYAKDVRDIKVWNYDYPHKLVFQPSQAVCSTKRSSDVMFTVVENNRLSTALLNKIHDDQFNHGNLIAWNSSLETMERSPTSGLVDVTAMDIDNGFEIKASAPLVLGCDGFKSKVRQLSNINYNEYDLKKVAVVGTVKMNSVSFGQQNGNSTAYQRFSPRKDTVAALLPLDENYSSFVISAPAEYSKYLIECDDVTFAEEFNRLLSEAESPDNPILGTLHNLSNTSYDGLKSFLQLFVRKYQAEHLAMAGQDLGEPPSVDMVVGNSRASFPLFFGTTTPRMIASLPGRQHSQIALLGDSSHRVHPLAGQGLNLGIQDAIELVKQLEKIVKSGEQVFGDTDHTLLDKALRRFQLKRQAYIVPMSAGILSMQPLFKLMPSRFVSSVNRCPFIMSTSVSVANGC